MADLIDLYNSIYTTLTADQSAGSFYDDVGGRIWLVDAPAQETLPQCVFSPVTEDLQGAFGSDNDSADLVFQVNIYSVHETTTPEALLAINDKLIALLDRQSVTISNWGCADIYPDDGSSRGTLIRDGDAWVVNSQWVLRASE